MPNLFSVSLWPDSFSCFLDAWAAPEGEGQRGSCPRPPYLFSQLPRSINFDGDNHAKVWFIKRHFCKKTQIFWSFLAFPNIKKQANCWLSLHVQKLSVSASGGEGSHLWLPDQRLYPGPRYIFSMHTTELIGSTFGPQLLAVPWLWPPPRCSPASDS